MKFFLMLLCFSCTNIYAAPPMIDGSYHASFSLNSDGTVSSWGALDWSSPPTIQLLPLPINNLSSIVSISKNYFVKNDGTVWHTIDGLSNTSASQKTGITNVKEVSKAHVHTLALKHDGTVWGWGDNQQGELGTGITSYEENAPVQVSGLSNIISISAGGSNEPTSFALASDGTLWAWGGNHSGKFGNGSTCGAIFCGVPIPQKINNVTGITSISNGSFHTALLKTNGTVWLTGSVNGLNFKQVVGLDNITAISAGNNSTLALKSNGEVVSISNGTTPVVSIISGLSNITFINYPGYQVYYAISNNGKMYAWGSNSNGRLGNGSTTSSATPIEVGVVISPPNTEIPTYKVPMMTDLALFIMAVCLSAFVVVKQNKISVIEKDMNV